MNPIRRATIAGICVFGALCASACLARAVPRYSPEQFYATTAYTGAAFSSDETRLLVSSDATGVFNVYAQPVAGGAPIPLTRSTADSTYAVAYFPDDDRFLYTADQGGNELNHLYVAELDGTRRDLTPGQNVKATFLGFDRDRKRFYVQTNERDAKTFDVYRYSVDGYTRQRIFDNDGRFLPQAVSRDGTLLALSEIVSNTRTDLWVRDIATGSQIRITPDIDATHSFFTFTPDGTQVIYGSNAIGEFVQAWSYTLASAQREPLTDSDWDVTSVGYSETGRYRMSTRNADANTSITLTDTRSGTVVTIPGLPPGDVRGAVFSRSESLLALYVSSDTSPANLYLHRLGSDQTVALTSSLSQEIDEAALVTGSVVHFDAFDGLSIPAILWRPRAAAPEHRAPALVLVHGGPGGQTRRGWSSDVQALVNHGYAVLAVNNRGSSGYGKTFYHADDRKHGSVDLQDCIYGKRYLQSLDWVAGDRIGIMGGSYGGYMVAAALTFAPTEFAVGVDIFGVTNWVRTLERIPSWWVAQRAGLYGELGDPAVDGAHLTAISPLFHARNIVRPLLVIQGKNDPRVLQVESDELVAAARANGVPVEYIVFADEGHGFTKKNNRIAALQAYLAFLGKHLPVN